MNLSDDLDALADAVDDAAAALDDDARRDRELQAVFDVLRNAPRRPSVHVIHDARGTECGIDPDADTWTVTPDVFRAICADADDGLLTEFRPCPDCRDSLEADPQGGIPT